MAEGATYLETALANRISCGFEAICLCSNKVPILFGVRKDTTDTNPLLFCQRVRESHDVGLLRPVLVGIYDIVQAAPCATEGSQRPSREIVAPRRSRNNRQE